LLLLLLRGGGRRLGGGFRFIGHRATSSLIDGFWGRHCTNRGRGRYTGGSVTLTFGALHDRAVHAGRAGRGPQPVAALLPRADPPQPPTGRRDRGRAGPPSPAL